MSVIIRLQNLPWSANSLDIRQFFRNLAIPDGGVNIVGGERGDAFIAFSTDEDARQAMMQNGAKIKDTPISLFLSSRAEMQKTIEQARARTLSMMANSTPAVVAPAKPQILAPQVPPQPPVISMSNFLSAQPTRGAGIEIPGLTNGYATAGASLLFNNLPLNMPSIVDTTKPALVLPQNGTSRRPGSGSPRSRSRSRSPRRRSRSPRGFRGRDRRRSRSRERHRSSSRESYDSGRGVWDSNRPSYQSGSGVPAFQSNPRQDFNRSQMAYNNGERVDNFGRKIVEPGKDVFGRDLRASREEESNACIKLTGLERSTGYGELRRQFTGMFITANGIKMINDERTGERMGIALIRFARRSDKEVALSRVNMRIRDAPIIVSNATDEEFEQAIDNFKPSSQRSGRGDHSSNDLDDLTPFTCIRVSDLPPYAKEQDIIKMFSDYAIMSICMGRNSKKVYEAYAKFYRPEDARNALKAMPSCRIQHKIVHSSRATELEFEAARNEFEMDVQIREEEEERREKQRKRDVQDENRNQDNHKKSRFDPVPAAPEVKAPIAPRDPRKPPSYSQQMLDTPLLTNPALNIHNIVPSYLQNNLLQSSNLNNPAASLQLPPTTVTSNASKPSDPRNAGNGDGPVSQNNGVSRDPRRRVDPRVAAMQMTEGDCILMKNLPPSLGEWDLEEYLADIGVNPTSITLCVDDRNKLTGNGVCEFSTPEQARKAAKLDNVNIGDYNVKIELLTRSEAKKLTDISNVVGGGGGASSGPSNGQQRYDNPYDSPRANFDGPQEGNFDGPYGGQRFPGDRPMGGDRYGNMAPRFGGPMGRPMPYGPGPYPNMGGGGAPPVNGRVILLENIPYKATTEDILEFFGPSYNLNPDHVKRRFNERGQPAGEAKVLFHTPADCMHAFNGRRGSMLLNRRVFLKMQ